MILPEKEWPRVENDLFEMEKMSMFDVILKALDEAYDQRIYGGGWVEEDFKNDPDAAEDKEYALRFAEAEKLLREAMP